MRTREELKQLRSLPLEVKIKKTQLRIQEYVDVFGEDGIYISFSGGKDSTVLLHIVRDMFPNIKAVFVNTGLEYPEISDFVKTFENVVTLRPKKNFRKVITEYGYPVISKEVSGKIDEVGKSLKKGNTNTVRYRQLMGLEKKENGEPSEFNCEKYKFLLNAPFKISDKCCEIMKKNPAHAYDIKTESHPFIRQLAEESKQRQTKWIKHGCNAFDLKMPQSNPLSFWTENDILRYIKEKGLSIASVYGEVVVQEEGQLQGQVCVADWLNDYRECRLKTTGCDRTGCMFCLHGAHREKGIGRLERMKQTHPERYEYVMGGGEFGPDGMWIPNNEGLGFKLVVDWLNEHGNLNIRY